MKLESKLQTFNPHLPSFGERDGVDFPGVTQPHMYRGSRVTRELISDEDENLLYFEITVIPVRGVRNVSPTHTDKVLTNLHVPLRVSSVETLITLRPRVVCKDHHCPPLTIYHRFNHSTSTYSSRGVD